MNELERRLEEKKQANMSHSDRKYDELLSRIVKGAEFIDTLSRDDPRYNAAMEKYDQLVMEAQRMRNPWIL